jgi:hypothetical protein
MSDDDSLSFGGGYDGGLDFGDDDDQYGGGGGFGGDSPGGSSDDDGSFGGDETPGGEDEAGSPGGEGEDINFGETFGDRQRTGGGALKVGKGFEGGAKASRSAEQAASEKAQGILSGETMYSGVKEQEKDKILALINRIQNIERCSIEVLVSALLFKVRRLDPKKDFQKFFKTYAEGIQAADLLRYIRQYESLKL